MKNNKNKSPQDKLQHNNTQIQWKNIKAISRPKKLTKNENNNQTITLTKLDTWLYIQHTKFCKEIQSFLENLYKTILKSISQEKRSDLETFIFHISDNLLDSHILDDKQLCTFRENRKAQLNATQECIKKLFAMLGENDWETFLSPTPPFFPPIPSEDSYKQTIEINKYLDLSHRAMYYLYIHLKIPKESESINVDIPQLQNYKKAIHKSLSEIDYFPRLTNPKDGIDLLENIGKEFFKKSGTLKTLLKDIPQIPDLQKRKIYAQVLQNSFRLCEAIYNQTLLLLKETLKNTHPQTAYIDISIPGRPFKLGKIHPITQAIEEISAIFKSCGFSITHGPEIETEYYNFEALNIPADHPARNEQDSFYIQTPNTHSPKLLLRTHTSPIQIRTMEKHPPPLAIITTGRCFRKDAIDATHYPSFYQLEGFQVDQGISFAHLKGILQFFAQRFFGPKTKVRLRPDYFPFTTPSAEFAVSCFLCEGKGCTTCSQSGFIEIGGCGLIDPKVFAAVKIDQKIYSGYAFGIGIDRLVMTKYKIPDIRILYQNDIRVLRQF